MRSDNNNSNTMVSLSKPKPIHHIPDILEADILHHSHLQSQLARDPRHPDMHGQNTSDRPDLTCRIFRAKLQRLLENGFLGRKVYMMYVYVEFQKRGLPHAHMPLCVTPQPQMTDKINQIVSAETPPESANPEDQRYHELVLRHMVQRHTPACQDKEGRCQKKFPKPLAETTYTDDRGYTHYRRQIPQDNCHASQLPPPHAGQMPHQRGSVMSCTVNLIMYQCKYIFKGPDHTQ